MLQGAPAHFVEKLPALLKVRPLQQLQEQLLLLRLCRRRRERRRWLEGGMAPTVAISRRSTATELAPALKYVFSEHRRRWLEGGMAPTVAISRRSTATELAPALKYVFSEHLTAPAALAFAIFDIGFTITVQNSRPEADGLGRESNGAEELYCQLVKVAYPGFGVDSRPRKRRAAGKLWLRSRASVAGPKKWYAGLYTRSKLFCGRPLVIGTSGGKSRLPWVRVRW